MKALKSAITALILAAVFGTSLSGCDNTDDQRIPVLPVRIFFRTPGEWNVYGVSGATISKRFIKELREPAGFPYSTLSETGFGGVLLVGNTLGQPLAFDLACPVEARRDVRIFINNEKAVGQCPKCGSTYNIYYDGGPLSGEANEKGYRLRPYRVLMPGPGGETAYVTN